MKKTIENKIPLGDVNLKSIYGGAYTPGGDLMYDLSYLLGYGFAWISSYIGNHAVNYGIAFK